MASTKKKTKKPEKPYAVTYSQNFAAIIRGKDKTGKNSLIVKSPTWYRHQLNKFKDGAEVTLVIHSERPRRSEQQNRYYWGLYLPLIAKETGESDLDRLHELFKGKFLTEGVVEVLGQKVRMKKSTTDLGVGEFCQYIIDIEALTGVEAPPTQNYGLSAIRDDEGEIAYPVEDIDTSKTPF